MAVPMIIAMSGLQTACSTSPETLENEVKDKPGVIRVEATEHDGDDGVPFQTIAKAISVTMDADATESQIMAVFDAYDDDIDDGEVYAIEVALDGPKGATLATGEDVHATKTMVGDLVQAQNEDDILEYRREAYPVGRSVYATLTDGDFREVVAFADRYRDAHDIDYVTVKSGDYLLIRDKINEDLKFTAAREEFVQEVALHFRISGAVVSGRGPLRLAVTPSDQQALRRYVERSPAADGLGRVRVSADAAPPI